MDKECEMCQEFKSYCSSCDTCFECLSQDFKKLEQQNKALRELVQSFIDEAEQNGGDTYSEMLRAKLKQIGGE